MGFENYQDYAASKAGTGFIVKAFSPDIYCPDTMPIVPLYIGKADTNQLVKQANHIQDFVKSLKKEAGSSFVRMVAMGSGEYYSSNANGDYFPESDLKKTHSTFEKIAYVFRHHKNKNPEKSYGTVVKSWYNPNMHRVELISKIANDKNRDILERLESFENVPVSMAAKVKYDICSLCGNEAKSFAEHCAHLKNSMNKIASDGTKVYAINPNPIFFDISFVHTPADSIAYALEKVASREKPIEVITKPKLDFEKVSLVRKFAEIEKQIEGMLSGVNTNTSETEEAEEAAASDDAEDKVDEEHIEIAKKSLPTEKATDEELRSGDMIAMSKKHNLLFEPEEFLRMCGIDDEEIINKVKSLLPGGFSRIMRTHEDLLGPMMKMLEGGGGIEDIYNTSELIRKKSMSSGPVQKRVITITITGEPFNREIVDNTAQGDSSETDINSEKNEKNEQEIEKEADAVALRYANLYNMYKIATAEGADPYAIVLHNYYQFK